MLHLKTVICSTLFFICCLSLISSCSPSAEYFVATTGEDTAGNGYLNTPFRTIQYALDQSVSGDTITLRGGTYNESIRIRNANMTIRSCIGEWAVIQSVTNDEEIAITVLFDVDSNGSQLQRVEVIGGSYYGIKFQTKWDWGDLNDRTGASNILIEDCIIHDTGNACIKITPGCDDITIRRCEIYNSGRNAPDSAEGIDNVNGDRMRVEQCNFHDITATGLYAKGGANGVTIERCLVKNCGGAGILIGFDTSPEFFDTTVNPHYYENINGTVTNCIVINTQYAGIGLYAAKDALVTNNTLVDVAQSGQAGLYFGLTYQDSDSTAERPPSVNPTIRNNILVQSASTNTTAVEIRYDDELGGLSGLSGMPFMSNNQYFVENGTAQFEDNRPGHELSGDLTQWQSHISGDTASAEGNPQFINAANGDFHLSITSPCRDTGTLDGAPSIDYEETTRPQEQGVDIGAYERKDTVEPDIKANGSDGEVTVSSDTPVSVTIALAPADKIGMMAEWWITVKTPCAPPDEWYTYVYPTGWISGIHMYETGILYDLSSFEILPLTVLSPGEYVFSFVLDDQLNGTLDVTWIDTVYVTSVSGVGHITYTYNGQVYRIQAMEGATSENISQALDSLSSLPSGGKDSNLNISPDGKWLVLETERFDDDCAGWACMAVVTSDLTSGNIIRVDGDVVRQDGFPVIASGGNLVIFSNDGGTHESDLWAVSRSSNNGNWETPVELTKASTYQVNYQPAISSDGKKVVFNCTNETYSGSGCICEVGTDGQGFHVVVTPADSPDSLPDTGDLHHPDYALDGSIVFEADWSGEQLWKLKPGATEPARVTDTFSNDNSPCILPDGSIASLWLNRTGGQGYHEIKVMTSDSSSYFMSLTDIDVLDIGLGCGN